MGVLVRSALLLVFIRAADFLGNYNILDHIAIASDTSK